MLEDVEPTHFEQLKGRTHAFEIADGGIAELRVDSVTLKPKSRIHDGARMPFTVSLSSTGASGFTEGLCAFELPDIGRVENIMVSRQAALGRDPQRAYFQILFN